MKLHNQLVIPSLLVLLLSCPALADTAEFTDGTGRRVAYGQNARRIVGLAPNVTEMLFFLGLGERVVGRSSFCDYPAAALRRPSVGGFADTSLELIVGLKPDLVVAYQGNSLELVGQLSHLGIEVLALPEAATLEQIGAQMETLHRVAAASGAEPPSALRWWKSKLDGQARSTVPLQDPPAVFYGMPGELVYTTAPGTFIDDLITLAGGRNVVPAGAQRWPQVGAEFILAARPDVLLVSTPCAGHDERADKQADTLAELRGSPVWRQLPAVQSGRVVVIDAATLMRPGPRILDALEQLRAALSAQ